MTARPIRLSFVKTVDGVRMNLGDCDGSCMSHEDWRRIAFVAIGSPETAKELHERAHELKKHEEHGNGD